MSLHTYRRFIMKYQPPPPSPLVPSRLMVYAVRVQAMQPGERGENA